MMKKSQFIQKFFILLFLFTTSEDYIFSQSNKTSQSNENKKYIPTPKVISTGDYLVGAFRCPLWSEKYLPGCWRRIKSFPERQPLIGWYEESNPEVIDWEIKYAVEHGISFFVECLFRKKENLGKPIEYSHGHWLDGLRKAKFRNHIRYMLLWENNNKIACGVESEDDLMKNLMPFLIEEHFKQPNYLIIEGKPVLMIYNFKKFIDNLGGVQNTKMATLKMRKAAVDAGFSGLWLLAEHHGRLEKVIPEIKESGFDVISSYHWPTFSGLMTKVTVNQQELIKNQVTCWSKLQNVSQLQTIPTVSMGWDSTPWGGSHNSAKWYLEPKNFEQLCLEAKMHMNNENNINPFSKMLLVDNWNEYGEGHYIFPTKQFGFGYLDAIRNVFSKEKKKHKDILPEDIGLGPYESINY